MSNRVSEEGGLHTYRTETPNIVYELGLTAFEYALYGVLKRTAGDSGKCWKSTDKLAVESGMSAGMVSKVKEFLAQARPQLGGKPLITITEEPNKAGGLPRHIITITDIWPENMRKYSSPHEQASSPHEQASSPHEQASSPHEIKKITIKKKPMKKDLPAAQAAPKEPTEHQQMFEKVCDIIGYDYKVIDESTKGQIAQALGILKKGGYSLDHLNRFGREVWQEDWRWAKHRQRPSLKDLRTEIGKLTAKPLLTSSSAAADLTGLPSFMYAQQENFYA